MFFIDASDGEENLAVNLAEVKFARYVGGRLDLYFEGGTDESLSLQGNIAKQLWREILKTR